MRCHGIENPYERLKELTRGRAVDRASIHVFIQGLELPKAERERLLIMTPETYLGCAEQLARDIDTGDLDDSASQ